MTNTELQLVKDASFSRFSASRFRCETRSHLRQQYFDDILEATKSVPQVKHFFNIFILM